MPRLLHDLVEAARIELLKAGVKADEARLDSELIARHVFGWDRARFIVSRRHVVPEATVRAIDALVRRRARREPLAYIVGEKEFWGRPFTVGPGVLIPRPETELVIETVLSLAMANVGTGRFVDVGTGSGCLAVTLALERPGWSGWATDIEAGALAIARANAARHGVGDRLAFVEGDLLAGTPAAVDLIVSNPPYAAIPDKPSLQPEVRDWEPPTALFGGEDGLDTIRRLVAAAVPALRPGGWLVFEIGAGQSAAVESLVQQRPEFANLAITADLQGIPRTVRVRRQ